MVSTATAKELPCGHPNASLLEGDKCAECGGSGTLNPKPGNPNHEYSIKDYRAAIRSLWLPIVARKKLNGAEMRFVEAMWERGEPIDLICQAIRAIDARRRARGLVVHSLGIIRADLETLKMRRSRMGVGGQGQKSEVRSQKSEAWREEWEEALEELAEEVNHPERAAMYRELKRDLPTLSEAEAKMRFRGIR